jgi:hypothetical protein
MVAGVVVLPARRDLWRAGTGNDPAFRAIADFASVALDSIPNEASSIGRIVVVRSKQANPFAAGHDSVATCGGGWRVQPANVAASAPMKSAFKLSSQRG